MFFIKGFMRERLSDSSGCGAVLQAMIQCLHYVL